MGFRDPSTTKNYQRKYYEEVTKKKRNGEESSITWICKRWKPDNANSNPFYIKIMELAESKNMSQSDLADAIGVSQSILMNYTSLRSRKIPIMAFHKLCNSLDIGMEELYTYYEQACGDQTESSTEEAKKDDKITE